MKKIKGMPITGATPQYSKKAPLVPDAKDTSAQAQTMIKEAPTPFKNNQTTPNLPVPGAAPGGVSTMEPKIQSGMKRSTPGARALPNLGPVGQRKPINQSGQIGGRKGFPPPKRRAGSYPSGYPAKTNANFYGE
jgi:hypothetical protein